MCGIAGLFSKSPERERRPRRTPRRDAAPAERPRPGQRGRRVLPRSRRPPARARCRCTARPAAAGRSWPRELAATELELRGSHAVLRLEMEAETAEALIREAPSGAARDERRAGDRDLQGGGPAARVRRALRAATSIDGQPRARPHAHGDREPRHDRALAPVLHRASTSASCTTARCRTTTACGSELRREGIEFQTDNDTEVAAGYLTWRMREGATLEQALEGCLDDLDGFYTFAVGTADGFAVLRDPIACKPAVMAETDDWVAMASEYRAIAVLPGAEQAHGLGAGARRSVYSWDASAPDRDRPRSTSAVTSLRELNAALHASPDDRRRALARARTRAARTRSPSGSTPGRGRDRRPRRLLLRRHEQAGHRPRPRQRRRRASPRT